MKIAFGMIVFEGDCVLKQCLEAVYPYASQILIAEGPVKYWQDKGRTTSTDKTNAILSAFPDPDNKIKITHGQFAEKDDQCNAYMQDMADDTDYLWNLDSDEIYKPEDIEKIIKVLEVHKPTTVGLRSFAFFGDLEHNLTGFELNYDAQRIFKVYPGCRWLKHRPPTIEWPEGTHLKHITAQKMFAQWGVQMYHYSYCFPRQVKNKIGYYKEAVSKEFCIDDYWSTVFLPWITRPQERKAIEKAHNGVHEFVHTYRGDCYTEAFRGEHPESIKAIYKDLEAEIKRQLEEIIKPSWATDKRVSEMQHRLNQREFYGDNCRPKHWTWFQDTLDELCKAKPVESLLDIGCGSGVYSLLIQERHKEIQYTGIDYAAYCIDLARSHYLGSVFKVMDYKDLTRDYVAQFDVVNCCALHVCLPDADEAMEFFINELRPKTLILSKIYTTDKPSFYTVETAYTTKTFNFRHNKRRLERLFYREYNHRWHLIGAGIYNILLTLR